MSAGVLPDWVFGEESWLEPFTGRSAVGPVYGPVQVLRCFVVDSRKLVRKSGDRERTSGGLQVFYPSGTEVPEESRVTVRGKQRTVTAVAVRAHPTLPVPDHVQVWCE